jgi:hypothetical protein
VTGIKVSTDTLCLQNTDLSTKLHIERIEKALYRFAALVRKKLSREIYVNNLCECVHASVSTTRANNVWLFF